MSTAPVGGRTLEALGCVQAACRRPRSGAGSSLNSPTKSGRYAKDAFAEDCVAEAAIRVHAAVAMPSKMQAKTPTHSTSGNVRRRENP